MRYSALAFIGIAALLLLGGLWPSDGLADAKEEGKDNPDTFAEYATHVFQVGDVVTLNRDDAAGHHVSLLSKEQADRYRHPSRSGVVKEVHADYLVVKQEDQQRSFERAIPFRSMTVIEQYTVKQSN
jgi:uncharacterized protein Veg